MSYYLFYLNLLALSTMNVNYEMRYNVDIIKTQQNKTYLNQDSDRCGRRVNQIF